MVVSAGPEVKRGTHFAGSGGARRRRSLGSRGRSIPGGASCEGRPMPLVALIIIIFLFSLQTHFTGTSHIQKLRKMWQ